MNLQNLKKEIPFQWRIQSCSKTSAKAQCVAYIDARDAMRLLDEVCGPENWQDEYYQVKDTMFCKIGIKVGDQWVWKSDGGDVTDVEAKKGESSDSFKRACVKWGVGRFLYDMEIRWVDTNGPKTDSNKYPYAIDENGKRIYDLTAHFSGEVKPNYKKEESHKPSQPQQSSGLLPCDKCGGEFMIRKGSKGEFYGCKNYKSKGCKRTLSLEEAMQWTQEGQVQQVFSDGVPLPTYQG